MNRLGMSAHRVSAVILLASVIVLAPAPPAQSQGGANVTLTLVKQTAWNSLKHPTIHVDVRAENKGSAPLGNLELVLTLGVAVRTRGDYDLSLSSGPPVPILTDPVHIAGSLDPAVPRSFSASVDLSAAVSHTESLIYPMLITLLSDGVPTGAELRSPALVVVRRPLIPLAFAWTFQLSWPPALDASGSLADRALEAAIAPGGEISSEIDALVSLAVREVPVDLVVSPLLVQTLARMAAGYKTADGRTVPQGQAGAAEAATALANLRRAVASRSTQLTSFPYAAPLLPALLSSPLSKDLATQATRGRDVISTILGAQPDPRVARAPGGALDQASAGWLAAGGASVLLVNSDTVQRAPDPLGFLQSPLASIDAGSAGPVGAIVPDGPTQAILSLGEDPVLRAQAALGGLMAAWQEHPGESRGIAVSLADVTAPPDFWQAFADRIAGAPFLVPMHADKLARTLEGDTGLPSTSPLSRSAANAFTHSYVDAIRQERHRVEAYASMLVHPNGVPGQLLDALLVAEAGSFVDDEPQGRAFIDEVNGTTGAVFAAPQLTTLQLFTLTSSSGTIPVTLSDPGNQPLRVIVQLSSTRLRFPEGSKQSVILHGPDQIVTFRVEAQGTGQSPVIVKVFLFAPSGLLLSSTTLTVRSTAFNRVALAVTIAAALGLVALWARRFLRRPT